MSNDLKLLKLEIFQKELVYELLESVGCENLRFNRNRIDGSRPTGDSPKGFSVFLDEDLVSKVWTRSVPTSDVIDLISYFKFGKKTREEMKNCIPNSKKYIIQTLGLEGYKNGKAMDMPDYNFHLRKIKKPKSKEVNDVLPESILNDFIMIPHIELYDEIPNYDLLIDFETGYDIQTNRMVFVYRNKNGDIIGVRGRAITKEDEDKAKYFPIFNFSKSLELYNLHRAMPHIIRSKKVFMFEGEKSPIKSTQYNYPNAVAFMGSKISEEQASLIKSIHPDLEFIVCMDKDKSVDDIKSAAIHLPHNRTYGIYDVDNLLSEKQSPVDIDCKTFETLIRNNCYHLFPNE